MRAKLLMFLAACMCLAYGCKDDDNGEKGAYELVYINGHDRDGNKAVGQQVEKAHDLLVWAAKSPKVQKTTADAWSLDLYSPNSPDVETFCNEKENIDTIRDRVSFWASSIIDKGQLNERWITKRDYYIVKYSGHEGIGDTVAYIPNAQLDAAEETIRKNFAEGNIAPIYEIFEDGFQFIPCTGAEFKEMLENGTN